MVCLWATIQRPLLIPCLIQDTVVGVCCNIFGDSFPPKYVPSFSWGGAHGFDSFDLTKAKDMASRVMSRREIAFSKEDEAIFDHLI